MRGGGDEEAEAATPPPVRTPVEEVKNLGEQVQKCMDLYVYLFRDLYLPPGKETPQELPHATPAGAQQTGGLPRDLWKDMNWYIYDIDRPHEEGAPFKRSSKVEVVRDSTFLRRAYSGNAKQVSDKAPTKDAWKAKWASAKTDQDVDDYWNPKLTPNALRANINEYIAFRAKDMPAREKHTQFDSVAHAMKWLTEYWAYVAGPVTTAKVRELLLPTINVVKAAVAQLDPKEPRVEVGEDLEKLKNLAADGKLAVEAKTHAQLRARWIEDALACKDEEQKKKPKLPAFRNLKSLRMLALSEPTVAQLQDKKLLADLDTALFGAELRLLSISRMYTNRITDVLALLDPVYYKAAMETKTAEERDQHSKDLKGAKRAGLALGTAMGAILQHLVFISPRSNGEVKTKREAAEAAYRAFGVVFDRLTAPSAQAGGGFMDGVRMFVSPVVAGIKGVVRICETIVSFMIDAMSKYLLLPMEQLTGTMFAFSAQLARLWTHWVARSTIFGMVAAILPSFKLLSNYGLILMADSSKSMWSTPDAQVWRMLEGLGRTVATGMLLLPFGLLMSAGDAVTKALGFKGFIHPNAQFDALLAYVEANRSQEVPWRLSMTSIDNMLLQVDIVIAHGDAAITNAMIGGLKEAFGQTDDVDAFLNKWKAVTQAANASIKQKKKTDAPDAAPPDAAKQAAAKQAAIKELQALMDSQKVDKSRNPVAAYVKDAFARVPRTTEQVADRYYLLLNLIVASLSVDGQFTEVFRGAQGRLQQGRLQQGSPKDVAAHLGSLPVRTQLEAIHGWLAERWSKDQLTPKEKWLRDFYENAVDSGIQAGMKTSWGFMLFFTKAGAQARRIQYSTLRQPGPANSNQPRPTNANARAPNVPNSKQPQAAKAPSATNAKRPQPQPARVPNAPPNAKRPQPRQPPPKPVSSDGITLLQRTPTTPGPQSMPLPAYLTNANATQINGDTMALKRQGFLALRPSDQNASLLQSGGAGRCRRRGRGQRTTRRGAAATAAARRRRRPRAV